MYRIGQLAALANVTPDTIRYYEKQGIMSHDIRSEGGYRLYNDQDLQRLRFIRYAKQQGLTLEATAELLSIRVDPEHHTCQESKAIVDNRLMEIEEKICELEKIRDSLRQLSAVCCGELHSSAGCSILEILEKGALLKAG